MHNLVKFHLKPLMLLKPNILMQQTFHGKVDLVTYKATFDLNNVRQTADFNTAAQWTKTEAQTYLR